MSNTTSRTTRQRLLELMANRIGPGELATRLQVPFAILRDWLDGHASMPDGKVLALLRLIDQSQTREAGGCR